MSDPPCLNFCCSKMGSSAASSFSPTFSSSTHRPKRRPFSRLRRKFLSLCFTTSSPFSAMDASLPRFLMKRLAWPWGSISSGQRRAVAMMMPLSMLCVSVGRPASVQLRSCTGSPSTPSTEQLGVCGMPMAASCSRHSALSCCRNSGVNAPRYDTAPAAMSASPATLWKASVSSTTVFAQRSFSPPSPPMSTSARSSRPVHSAISFTSSSFCCFDASKRASSCATRSTTCCSTACASARSCAEVQGRRHHRSSP